MEPRYRASVPRLEDPFQAVWQHAPTCPAGSDRGRVAGGVYFYRLTTEDWAGTKRMVFVK